MVFPQMVMVELVVDPPSIGNVRRTVLTELAGLPMRSLVHPGMRIAVTAGSRGINDIVTILAAVVELCKRLGAEPFVVPAMGSHGGASAGGQLAVLRSLGITEETVDCPIHSSLDVVQIGTTEQDIPVLIDKAAGAADGIAIVNRIKRHEEYGGGMGSGLMKMMAIGLGKYEGAVMYHRHAVQLGLRTVITSVARIVMKRAPVLFGLGIVENVRGETAHIAAVEPGQLEETEKMLFREAEQQTARLPVDQLDVLIVDELGKEISGTGMDAHTIGRLDVLRQPKPESPGITRIVVRDLTDATHGNAAGVGFADYVTRRLLDRIDHRVTYVNCMASMTPEEARIPIVADTDREAIQWALQTSGVLEASEARVMRIKNTLFLERLHVSRALLAEMQSVPHVKVLGRLKEMAFDVSGTLMDTTPDCERDSADLPR